MSRRRLALALTSAVILVIIAMFAGRNVISSPSVTPRPTATVSQAPAPAAATAAPVPVPAGFATFSDAAFGYSIAVPQTWRRLPTSDKQVRLLAADGTRVSLLIRVSSTGLNVTPETLGIARALTDRLVGADQSVRLLTDPETVLLDGLPGYRYRYTSGGGAHVHYFVFSGTRLISLVFQVPGARALIRESELLDRIAGTFRAVQ